MEPIFKRDALHTMDYLEFNLFCASILEDEYVLRSLLDFINKIEQLHKKDEKKDADS